MKKKREHLWGWWLVLLCACACTLFVTTPALAASDPIITTLWPISPPVEGMAVDNAGNVSNATNKGRYYAPATTRTASAARYALYLPLVNR